jgi:transposase
VVRKNWLFSTSPKGAEASACVYSIIETCKANNIDPEKYLIYLFTRMPNEERLKGETVLEKYMPWNPAMQESCK